MSKDLGNLLKLTSIILALSACGRAPAATIPQEGRFLALTEELRDACNIAGGSLLSSFDCHCPDGNEGKARIFDADSMQCIESTIINQSCKSAPDSSMRACLFTFARNGSMRLNLNAGTMDYPYIRNFIEDVAGRLPLRLPSEKEGNLGGTLTLHIGNRFAPNHEMMEKLTKNQLYPSAYEREPGVSFLYLDNIQDLPAALGLADRSQELFVKGNYSDEIISQVSQLLSAWQTSFANIAVTEYDIISPGRSCLIACKITTTRSVPGFLSAGLIVRTIERFQKGLRLPREIVLIRSDTDTTIARILMDFSDRPSLVLTQEVKRVHERIFTETKVYDRSLQLISTVQNTLIDNVIPLLERLKENKPLGAAEVPIAVFEPGLDVTDATLSNSILTGPHTRIVNDPIINLGGWYRDFDVQSPLSYRGLIPTTYEGTFLLNGSPGHAKAVSNILISSSEIVASTPIAPVRLIPLGQQITSPVAAEAVELARQRTDNRLRVGSLQYKVLMDEASCSRSFGKLFRTGILLVTAAGNERRDLSDNELCPAILGGRPDLMVVAAATENGLAPYSNSGRKLVDIAAHGKSLDLTQEGTSFAAPRVASILAQLASRFPNRSNGELRAAVLLSAKIPASPLPVRSGGLLNLDLELTSQVLASLTSHSNSRNLVKRTVPFDLAVPAIRIVESDNGQVLGLNSKRRLNLLISSEYICKPVVPSSVCSNLDKECRDMESYISKTCD